MLSIFQKIWCWNEFHYSKKLVPWKFLQFPNIPKNNFPISEIMAETSNLLFCLLISNFFYVVFANLLSSFKKFTFFSLEFLDKIDIFNRPANAEYALVYFQMYLSTQYHSVCFKTKSVKSSLKSTINYINKYCSVSKICYVRNI